MVVLVEILVFRVIAEEAMEETKGDKEKEAAEGGDEVGVERKVEEAEEEEEEEESQGDGDEPDMDVDLLAPDWTSCSE